MTGTLPPFGRAVAELRRQGRCPVSGTVLVLVDHWPETRPERTSYPRVVLPADAAPDAFDWSFLTGLDAVVVAYPTLTGRERLRALLRCLLAAEPVRLLVADRERSRIHWIKSASRGVEFQP